LKAIKNKQYALWPGLTWQATNKHYPESKETLKGHGPKTKSGLRSTKTTTESDNDNNNENANAMHLPWPTIKQKEEIIKTYNLSNEAKRLMYTNQTGKFPKKLSRCYQYIEGVNSGTVTYVANWRNLFSPPKKSLGYTCNFFNTRS
jgi:hypothetical protein